MGEWGRQQSSYNNSLNVAATIHILQIDICCGSMYILSPQQFHIVHTLNELLQVIYFRSLQKLNYTNVSIYVLFQLNVHSTISWMKELYKNNVSFDSCYFVCFM